jgi:SAM-dependent methyltransferase
MAGESFRRLRLAEVEDSIRLLQRFGASGGRLLEIGAGTGWQAKALADAGYEVEAIDLPAETGISGHAAAREWPIRDYDGAHIPFPDASFDLIYSSNVLEHVEQLEELAADMQRVLRPGGIALHLVPNRQWRLLSLLTYYPGQVADFLRWLRRERQAASPAHDSPAPSSRGLLAKALHRLIPPTHGAEGTPLSELARFSKRRWDDFFQSAGWDVLHYGNNGLAASGDYLLGTWLGITMRRRVGRAIGGIAHVYVTRPRAAHDLL